MPPGFDTVLVPIHRAGWPFIAAFLAAAGVLGLIWPPLGWVGCIATAWCVYFFRDPERVTPTRQGLVIAPADGRIASIGLAIPPADLDLDAAPMIRISIFLNIFDVHVNRLPVDGKVIARIHHRGTFVNASLDKASEQNERLGLVIQMPDERKIGLVQIAGLVARRIVCTAREGDSAQTGQRYGMIRFGSRVDTWLPEGTSVQVVVGQRTMGGETVVADFTAREGRREGARR